MANSDARTDLAAFDMDKAILADAEVKLAQIRDEPRFEFLLPSEAAAILRALQGVREYAESVAERMSSETGVIAPGGVLSVMEKIIRIADGKPVPYGR